MRSVEDLRLIGMIGAMSTGVRIGVGAVLGLVAAGLMVAAFGRFWPVDTTMRHSLFGGAWIALCIALVVAATGWMARQRVLLMVLAAVVVFGVDFGPMWLWPQSGDSQIRFQDASVFTPERKTRITNDVRAYYQHLAKLGFRTPSDLPVLRPAADSSVFGRLGQPARTWTFTIDERLVDDPFEVLWVYSLYAFDLILDSDRKGAEDESRTQSITAISNFFIWDYLEKLPPGPEPISWPRALWKMRESLGVEFTRQAVTATIGALNDPKRRKVESGSFDRYFYWYFTQGLTTMKAPAETVEKVKTILGETAVDARLPD